MPKYKCIIEFTFYSDNDDTAGDELQDACDEFSLDITSCERLSCDKYKKVEE